jgi:hypothetical protein
VGRKGNSRPRQRPKRRAVSTPATEGSTRVTREQRIAHRRRAVRRRQRRNSLIVVVAVVIGIGAFSLNFLSQRRSNQRLESALTAGSCRVDEASDRDSGTGRNHVASPSFEVNPPSGGNHTVQAASAGDFTGGNVPPDGQVVHALEHGYIALWYRPDTPAETLDALRGVRTEFDRDVLLLPRTNLPVSVAATAWHHRLLCDTAEPEPLRRFVRAYRNKGPERVPH